MKFLSFIYFIFIFFSHICFAQEPQLNPEQKNQTETLPPDPNSDLNKPQTSLDQKVNQPEQEGGLSRRDPFKLPEYIIIKIRQKAATNIVTNVNLIDESIEPIRRWPLATYQLVGIIWDVKKSKAMFLDRNQGLHILATNDFIGNSKGVITSIQSGSVIVLEGRIPQIIKLKK